MKVGDRVTIKRDAWDLFLQKVPGALGVARDSFTKPPPEGVEITKLHPEKEGVYLLASPLYWWWWREHELTLVPPSALVKQDTPLPEKDDQVVNLDDHRIRSQLEFQDECVAYVEALWGRETYAFNAAVRNLEAMRRGEDDGSLRQPETHHEALHLILHVRALANDLARHFGILDLVRPADDLPNRK